MSLRVRSSAWGFVTSFVVVGAGLSGCGDFSSSTAGTGVRAEDLSSIPNYVDPAPAAPPKTPAAGTAQPGGVRDYTVVLGDGAYVIAKRFKCKAADIAKVNKWAEGPTRELTIGETIKLPPSCKRGNVAAPPTTADPTKPGTYKIKSGDALYAIATKLGTTVDKLMAVNGWTGSPSDVALFPGQVIKTPPKRSS